MDSEGQRGASCAGWRPIVPIRLIPAAGPVFRVGPVADPFSPGQPLQRLVDCGRPEFGGNRWDAPAAEFRTLYCARDPVTAFAETIAPFRIVRGHAAKLREMTDDGEADAEFDFELLGGRLAPHVFEPPRGTRHARRAIGRAQLTSGMLVDVSHQDTHHELNLACADLATRCGFACFDRGVVMSQDRRITRTVAAYLWGTCEAIGISYESRYVHGLCVALWDVGTLLPASPREITNSDPDLRRAATLLRIEMPPQS